MYMDIDKEYINFGDFCRQELNMQCQTGYYYLEGFCGLPQLKEGLRIIGNDWNYHSLRIQKDDALIFKERIKAHKKQYGFE